MKVWFSVIAVFALAMSGAAQSGRRARDIAVPLPPAPPVEQPASGAKPKPQDNTADVTAESNQNYRCAQDGTLEMILDQETGPKVFSVREVDTRATILSRPPPSYTKEARRSGVQGFVVMKALLSADARVERVKIVKRLPAGLTENAIRAACKLKFKPAMKDGQSVAQMVTVEYVFRLAHSSIFGP